MILFISIYVANSLPIEKAMPYFRFVAVVMSILVLSSIVGLCYYMSQVTFQTMDYVKNTDPETEEVQPYIPTGEYYFNWLTLAGVIMLSVYTLPFLLRPIDFLTNFKKYTLGFLSFMLLMPMITNVFQIYAMCNLHDISWGNRPTTTGTETYTANK